MGSPSSTNKVTPHSWKWVTRPNQQSRSILLEMYLLDAWRMLIFVSEARSNQQSRSILLEMCLLDAWRRCNQQSATRILEMCLLDAWCMIIFVSRFGWLGQALEPYATCEEFHGFNCSMWTGSLVAYSTGGPGHWTTDSLLHRVQAIPCSVVH